MPEKENIHKGHRQRMMQRYLQLGINSFSEREMLEMMLYTCCPRRDTNGLAQELLEHFGSLEAVMSADYHQLIEIDGMGKQSAATLGFINDFARRYSPTDYTGFVLSSPDVVIEFCKSLARDRSRETVHLLLLDNNYALLRDCQIARGVIETVHFELQPIVTKAVELKCSKIILVHNHPNGIALASSNDVAATRRAVSSLRNVGIDLIDHVILGGDEAFSMRHGGMLPDLWDSDERIKRRSDFADIL